MTITRNFKTVTSSIVDDAIAAAIDGLPEDEVRSDPEINTLIQVAIDALPDDQVRSDAEINALITPAITAAICLAAAAARNAWSPEVGNRAQAASGAATRANNGEPVQGLPTRRTLAAAAARRARLPEMGPRTGCIRGGDANKHRRMGPRSSYEVRPTSSRLQTAAE